MTTSAPSRFGHRKSDRGVANLSTDLPHTKEEMSERNQMIEQLLGSVLTIRVDHQLKSTRACLSQFCTELRTDDNGSLRQMAAMTGIDFEHLRSSQRKNVLRIRVDSTPRFAYDQLLRLIDEGCIVVLGVLKGAYVLPRFTKEVE